LDNGELLDAMAGRFDVLLTVDKQLRYQQRLQGRPIDVIVLRAKSNRLFDLLPLVPAIVGALSTLQPGDVNELSG
jgi:hypothetical protein